MTSKNTWKALERFFAEWFDSKRNPLSGRNNVDDQGQTRPGDVIYKHAIVECKLRAKNAIIERAKETKTLADQLQKPWIHLEALKGSRNIICIALPQEDARECVRFLRNKWEEEKKTI